MQSNFRVNKLQLVVLLALLFTAAFAMAQGITAGSISGTVVDPSSAVVSGATVTAQNIATGQTLTAETNDTGYFTFRSVPPGAYKITIAGKGFRTVEDPAGSGRNFQGRDVGNDKAGTDVRRRGNGGSDRIGSHP